MYVKIVGLMATLMIMGGIATAQDLPIQGTFGKAGENGLPENWEQEKGDNLKPFGKAEVVAEIMETPIKAVRLVSESAPTIVRTTQSYPVKTDDCIMIRATFKGNGVAKVGCQGHDADMSQSATSVEHSFKTYSDGWDCRSKVFEIKDPKTAFIKIFFSTPTNTSMTFANITARKLEGDEARLYSPTANRELWKKRTQGENLAAGKKVAFDPKPSYELTVKGGSDETDLTDGKFGSPSDTLWFDTEAVAWLCAFNGATMIVDLGEVRPVRKVVVRINGGYNGITFPNRLEAWASKDGTNYYQTAGLTKVAPAEYYLSDWKTLYYLPEAEGSSGVPYVYPFELEIDADARYVAVRAPIYTALMMVTDELAVIKAEEADRQDQRYNTAYQKQARPLFHHTAIIRPRLDKFYIPDNVQVPNWLRLDDRREDKSGKFGYIIDVPASVDFAEDKSYPAFTRTLVKTEDLPGRKRFHFVPNVPWETFEKVLNGENIGPLFFFARVKDIPNNEKYVEFTTTVDGKAQYSHRSPLKIISIPEVPGLKKLTTSLAWMRPDQSCDWPDFLKAQRHLGFNTIPFSPQLRNAEKYKSVLDDAAKQGFKIRLQMSPTGMMKAFNRDVNEYKCIGSKTKKTSACPAYRGEYYQKMLDGIAEAVAKFPADYVTFDEESWEPTQLDECLVCSRCDELRKSKGMSWRDYLEWAQADYLKGFKLAVAKGAGKNKMPVIGYYALTPDHTYSCSAGKIPFLGYKFLYPEWCDEIQPSYYGNDSREMHDKIRKVFQKIPKPEIIVPWLTAGSGAHRATAMLNITEQEILEALMNGAGGLQYFAYFSFESPLDYYYHASALKKIAPYEEFLMKAKLVELTGSNPELVYTARRHDKEMLLLVGNYGKMTKAETVIELPPGEIASVVGISQKRPATGHWLSTVMTWFGWPSAKFTLKGNSLAAKIKPDDFGLYHIQYK